MLTVANICYGMLFFHDVTRLTSVRCYKLAANFIAGEYMLVSPS